MAIERARYETVRAPGRRMSRHERAQQIRADSRDLAHKITKQSIIHDTQIVNFKISAAVAVGEHAMSEITELDDHRVFLAAGDPTKNMLLAEFEAETVQQVKNLQRSLFNDWRMP